MINPMPETTISELEAKINDLESRLTRLEKHFPQPAKGARAKRSRKDVAVSNYMKRIRQGGKSK